MALGVAGSWLSAHAGYGHRMGFDRKSYNLTFASSRSFGALSTAHCVARSTVSEVSDLFRWFCSLHHRDGGEEGKLNLLQNVLQLQFGLQQFWFASHMF